MAVKFTTTSKASESANVLVYAESGVGKTVLSSTAPCPVIISSEKGLMSISDYNFPVMEVQSLGDFNESLEIIEVEISKKSNKWKTVVLDSISDISESILADLLRSNKDGRKAYGLLNTEVSSLIRKFRDLPINTYFIAKAETFESAAGLQSLRPAMPGKKLATDLPFFFDIVLAMRIKEVMGENEDDEPKLVRYLQTQMSTTHVAKDRSKKLDPIEEPNLKKLFKKIRG